MADSFGIRPPSLRETVTGQVQKKTPPLSEQQFFHGTTADLKPGDQLLPSAKTGKENYDYDYMPQSDLRRNSVFLANSEGSAWEYSMTGTHNRSSRERPTVYQAVPEGGHRTDLAGGGAVMSPSARVVNRIDIPPPGVPLDGGYQANAKSTPHGVQGTLPPVNWQQFGEPDNGVDYSRWLPGGDLESKGKPVRDPNQGNLF